MRSMPKQPGRATELAVSKPRKPCLVLNHARSLQSGSGNSPTLNKKNANPHDCRHLDHIRHAANMVHKRKGRPKPGRPPRSSSAISQKMNRITCQATQPQHNRPIATTPVFNHRVNLISSLRSVVRSVASDAQPTPASPDVADVSPTPMPPMLPLSPRP